MSKNNQIYDSMVNFNILDKSYAMNKFREEILNKTAQIFEYEGLPDTIPVEILELFLQANGNVLFHKVKDDLYIFTGGLGGVPDVYYRPTIYTIANPALNYNKSVKIDEEGVLMRNDNAMQGLLPMIHKWGSLLIETIISIRMVSINSRIPNALAASTDKEKASAELFLKQIEDGKLGVISENAFLEGIKSLPTTQHNSSLADLRETYQYIKSTLYSDLGMKVSHNMKREYVSEEENIVNDDTLLPLVDNMLWNRQKSLKLVNEMYGTNITVKLNGAWELQHEELEKSLDIVKMSLEEEMALEESESASEIEEDAGIEGEPEGSEETNETEEEINTEESEEDTTEEGNTEESEEDSEPEVESEPDIDINIVVGDNSEISTEEETEEIEEPEPETETEETEDEEDPDED